MKGLPIRPPIAYALVLGWLCGAGGCAALHGPSTRCGAYCTCAGMDCTRDHVHCPYRFRANHPGTFACSLQCTGFCIRAVGHTGAHECSHKQHPF